MKIKRFLQDNSPYNINSILCIALECDKIYADFELSMIILKLTMMDGVMKESIRFWRLSKPRNNATRGMMVTNRSAKRMVLIRKGFLS